MNPILQFMLVVAGSFGVILLLASYLKFEKMADAARESPDTLSARARFQLYLVKRIGPGWRPPSPFTLLLFEVSDPESASGVHDARIAFEAGARPLFRESDEWIPAGDNRIAVLLPVRASGAQAALRRVFDPARSPAIRSFPGVRAGVVSYPSDSADARRLLSQAEEALSGVSAESPTPWAWIGGPPESPTPDPAGAGTSSHLDPLTGTVSSGRLGPAARKVLSHRRINGLPVSVLHVDINRMHEINDRYGQETGDAALRNVAAKILETVRETDLIGRLGGDDFIVVLDSTPDRAAEIGARIIEAVRFAPLRAGPTQLHLALSIGCVGYPEFRGSFQSLFEAADLAMRAARQTGSNLCVRYRPELRKTVRISKRVEDRF